MSLPPLDLQLVEYRLSDVVGTTGPDVDNLIVALTFGDDTLLILAFDFVDLLTGRLTIAGLLGGMIMSSIPMETPARVAILKPASLRRSSVVNGALATYGLVSLENHVTKLAS